MLASSLLLLTLLQQEATPPPPRGEVLFERKLEQPAPDPPPPGPALHPRVSSSVGEPQARVVNLPPSRWEDFQITSYDLDLHLNYSTGEVTTRARITVRNNLRNLPMMQIPLQISSSLRWQSGRLRYATESVPLRIEQHPLATDTDHTGRATETIIDLPMPVNPGGSVDLDLFYEGTLVENADRLLAIGAPSTQANAAEWDGFNSAAPVSGVRGFGNVLWYPVIRPAAMLGDGNKLFTLIAADRAEAAAARFHLRLTVESATPLTTAFFCGDPQPLKSLSAAPVATTDETSQLPATNAASIYTAEWTLPALARHAPSLFLAGAAAVQFKSGLIDAYTDRPETLASYNTAAENVRPMLQAWLGVRPLGNVTLLDLGDRSALPYQDGVLVVLPLKTTSPSAMIPPLTHAWFRAPEPWMTEGLAAFMQTEWQDRLRRGSREAVAAPRDDQDLRALAMYETASMPASESPVSSSSATPERAPLTQCAEPICYRTKGAAVWRMLRDITGEAALQQSLQAYRTAGGPSEEFEKILEHTSGKDLAWFFDDWVLHDRGLPDLSITGVAPRQVTAPVGALAPRPQSALEGSGWLVAVEVRNDGDAVAEVPVTLRGDSFNATERLRIAAHSRASVRMLVPAAPTQVEVNDGTVPEVAASTHTRTIQPRK